MGGKSVPEEDNLKFRTSNLRLSSSVTSRRALAAGVLGRVNLRAACVLGRVNSAFAAGALGRVNLRLAAGALGRVNVCVRLVRIARHEVISFYGVVTRPRTRPGQVSWLCEVRTARRQKAGPPNVRASRSASGRGPKAVRD